MNFLVLPLLIVLVTALMASLALPLGPLLRSMPPLRAYAIDIGGSMLGIAGVHPARPLSARTRSAGSSSPACCSLLLALGVRAHAVVGRRRRRRWSLVIGASAAVASAATTSGRRTTASHLRRLEHASTTRPTATAVLHVVDGIPHQQIWDSTKAAQSDLHGQAYALVPGRVVRRVLIIGAGTGTDTALALAKGAKHVDAVEIDPKLAQIGRDFHPEHAYNDPRVTVHVNDGRAFLNGRTRSTTSSSTR